VRPNIKKLGAVYALSAQDPAKLGPAGEGMYCITSYPTYLAGLDTPANKEYRDIIGVGPDGIEKGTGKRFVLAYNWAVWEGFFALKNAIEKAGWKDRKDTPKVIQALEGMALKEGLEFPQGSAVIRKQDHLIQTGLYVEKVEKGKIGVVAKIPAADVEYPPIVDHSKEQF
jgi:branched-chain amino acid transport system substrate-binding protein